MAFNVQDLKSIDDWQTENMGLPLAVGTVIDKHYNLQNAGEWHTLPDGEKIWQLTIRATGAVALMLYYSEFYIPEGGKLFIYNTEKSHILGAYTSRTNPAGGRFATEFVAGDELTLEYVAAPSDETPRIEIEGVGYGYNNLFIRSDKVELRAGACEVNVNCEEGDTWQNQKKGVCRMVQRIGSKEYLCSASLVNNTAQDLKPYILTAHHCSFGSSELTASEDDMAQWVFYFHYEREGCEASTSPVETRTMTGCRKIAVSDINGRSDGLLLLLNEMIPQSYNVYYNGWDNRDTPAKSGVSIHHPQGDSKAISTFLSPVSHYTFESLDGIRCGLHAHWNAVFDATATGYGITERGSSGAPLFNENKLIVGTLTGGNSTCLDPGGLNLYGKMSYHWNKYPFGDTTRMDIWLDPLHSGAQSLTGRYHAGVLPAPRNLEISYYDKKVRLTWRAPDAGNPSAYHVYDNHLRVARTKDLSYGEELSDYGSHNYSVSAVYDNNNESEFINQSLFVPEYKTPANVSAVFTVAGKVAVSWQSPVYEQVIYWGEKHAGTSLIIDDDESGSAEPFYFGQLWTKDDISPLHRKTLTAVKFLPVRNNTYEIYIAQGNRVYRQKIASSSYSSYYETNTIALSTPFVIDGNSQLIVALYVENPRGYPAYCDAGPALSGKGDIYSYDAEKWESLYESDNEFNMNFFIAAVVTSTEGDLPLTYAAAPEITISQGTASPKKIQAATAVIEKADISLYSLPPMAFLEVSGYNIYRNNVKISTASASMRRYVDPEDLKVASSYQVSTLYNNYESDLSSKAEIAPMSNESVKPETIALRPNVFDNNVEISGISNVSRIEVYAIDGKLCLQLNSPDKTVNTQSLQAGVYIFRIYTRGNVCHTVKGVKRGR
ncbi:MAG: T9SS type A sorting domain-containing protein [Tannerella sp.]|nr:T9SS type A sorting domain-containing protein [Tannerella sp.]